MSASLAALGRRLAADAGARVLVTRARSLSVADTLDAVEHAAGQLVRERVRVLAIAAGNSPDWVIADLAAQRAGIPVVPLAPFFSAAQVVHALADSGADAIAADEHGSTALRSLPTRFARELTEELTLLRIAPGNRARPLPPGTAKISYTSGTTGAPKGVCLAQSALDRVAAGLHETVGAIGMSRHLCLLPLAVLLENVAGVYAPLISGGEIALPPLETTGILGASGLDAERLVACIAMFEPESIILLPQLLAGLVGAVERGASLPGSLRFAAVGGGVVGKALLDRAGEAGIPVFEGYGLTECGSVVALNTPAANRRGSVGRPLPHCRVRIGACSEVFVEGASLQAYIGEGKAHRGEVATGDIGSIDADGYLHISGRRKNVLITAFGRNLSPEWVEATLTATAPIAQAALFGDGKPFNVAVIAAARGASIAAIETAVATANRSLPDYARVRHWVPAAEPFSTADGTTTANGRLCRNRIGERYRAEIEACYESVREHCG